MKEFEDYNEELANNYTEIEIHNYIKEVNKRLNKTLPKDKKLNLDFMDDFLKLCHTNEMCIPAELLITYRALSESSNSNNIKLFLEANNLKEGVDYRQENFLLPVPQGGFVNKNEYFLRPTAFKYCLLCAIKCRKRFASYFLLIETCIEYYNIYKHMLKDKYLLIKDKKIDDQTILIQQQSEKLDQQSNKIDQQSIEIKELLKRSDKVLNKLTDVEDELKNTNEILEETNDKLDTVLEDKVVFPEEKNKFQTFILFKISSKKYKVIFGSNSHINKEVRKIKKEEFKQLTQERINKLSKKLDEDKKELAIKRINRITVKELRNKYTVQEIEKVPSCYYLRTLIKEQMTNNYKYNYSTMT